jgi:ketosteroid isomerase-like protein
MTTTDVGTSNMELVRKGFEAFAAGNMEALGELFDPNATWHSAPAGVLGGDYRGRDAIFAMFGQLHKETAGTFRSTPVAMAASSDKVFAQTEVSGERKGRKLKDGEVIVFTLTEGRVREVHLYNEHYPAALEFWS